MNPQKRKSSPFSNPFTFQTNPLPFLIVIFLMIFFSVVGCSKKSEKTSKSKPLSSSPKSSSAQNLTTGEVKSEKGEAENETIKIVFLGDSLTEGYNLNHQYSYPSQLERKLNRRLQSNASQQDGKNIQVEAINGGLSGDTTIGGLKRLDWFLKLKPDYLFLALGANDGLRGIDLKASRENLSNIIYTTREAGVTVLLTGMELPLNYGERHRTKFRQIYIDLVDHFQIPFLPFLLEGVGGEPELNLEDGIHPNEKGYDIISDRVAEFLYPILTQNQ